MMALTQCSSKDRASLEAYIEPWRTAVCDYENFDCVRFVSGWIEQRTGKNPIRDLPEWRSKRSGVLVATRGHSRVSEHANALLGASVAISEAQWGDVVGIDGPPLDPLGIVDGREGIFLSPLGGLKRVPLRVCSFAWRIECRL